ncbi:MAG: hypothetical protein ACR2OD_13290 [Gaiellaceae bacterium]
MLETADRLERDALAGCVAHPSLVEGLARLAPEVFDDAAHRALRNHLVDDSVSAENVTGLLAELDARASREAIDERTTQQLLLQLEARALRRELAEAAGAEPPARAAELRAELTRVQDEIRELG